jgi:hypothetical protein
MTVYRPDVLVKRTAALISIYEYTAYLICAGNLRNVPSSALTISALLRKRTVT